MAKFKDIHTGSEVVFTSEYDIKMMKDHPDYVEVVEEVKVVKPAPKKETKNDEK